MLITTTPFIEGRPVREYKGAIYAQSILGATATADLWGAIRDFIRGQSRTYESALAKCRTEAMKGLEAEAAKVGANAVIGVDLDYNTVGPQATMLMVSVSGTAVVI